MSHYLKAKHMLSDPFVRDFIHASLNEAFADGYVFQNPPVAITPSVEIFIKKMEDRKSLLFAAAMRVMAIEFIYPCGVTRQIDGTFRAEIRELKKLLASVSGLEPDEDTNTLVDE